MYLQNKQLQYIYWWCSCLFCKYITLYITIKLSRLIFLVWSFIIYIKPRKSIPYCTDRYGWYIPYWPAIQYRIPLCFVLEKILAVLASKWIPGWNVKSFFFLVNFDIFQGQDGVKLSKLRKPSRKKEKNERKMHNSFAKWS